MYTRSGNKRFAPSVIRSILRNEKYMGDMRLQKTTVKKIGQRSSVTNRTKPSYYVKGNHNGIISREDFVKVQSIIKERQKLYKPKKDTKITEHKYSNFVYSMLAGKFYKSKVNHRGKPYEVMLLELLDNKKDRILDVKNIYYSQIDFLIHEVTTLINKKMQEFKDKAIIHFKEQYETSSIINETLNAIENLINEVKQKKKPSLLLALLNLLNRK